MSLRSKRNITICRPIPAFIPRQIALGVLHDHSEVITLNPLVLSHHRIQPPIDAPADEKHSTWYEINERIQFIPGLGKAGSSTINFNGVFHDVPWGLQTHIYAPMNIDMRAQYRIAGSQAGVEAAAPRELGLEKLGAPKEGLYLRADIEFKCNIALASFVKSQTSTAIEEMVNRMVKKAEQLDSDILQGMIKEERESVVSRTQSREQDVWQGQPLNQTQSYTQSQVQQENAWPGQQLNQSKSQIQELDTPHTYPSRPQQPTQPPEGQQYEYQPRQPRTYTPPTIAAELDAGPPASSGQSGWSQPTSAYNPPYPQVITPPEVRPSSRGDVRQDGYPLPAQGRPSSRGDVRQEVYPLPPQGRPSSRGDVRQEAYPQPSPGRPSSRGDVRQEGYSPPPHSYAQPQPQQYQSYRYQEHVGQPQQQQYTQQSQYPQQNPPQHPPQFQESRKYSFDADRLQPENLNGASGRRWSAQYT